VLSEILRQVASRTAMLAGARNLLHPLVDSTNVLVCAGSVNWRDPASAMMFVAPGMWEDEKRSLNLTSHELRRRMSVWARVLRAVILDCHEMAVV
jgi:hypothetical protein